MTSLADRLHDRLAFYGIGLDGAKFTASDRAMHMELDVTCPTIDGPVRKLVEVLGEAVAASMTATEPFDVYVTANVTVMHSNTVQQKLRGIRFSVDPTGHLTWPLDGDDFVAEGPRLRSFAHTFQAFVRKA